jgi:putative heme-binding domain-containing protein
MHRIILPLLFLVIYLSHTSIVPRACAQSGVAVGEPRPQWIWVQRDRQPNTSATFAQTFELKTIPQSVVLTLGGESVRMEVSLDGRIIKSMTPYESVQNVDLTHRVGRGEHQLSVRCQSVAGPAAFFARLKIVTQENSRCIVTSPSWTATRTLGAPPTAAVSFGDVDGRLWIDGERRVGVSRLDNYEQWRLAGDSADGEDAVADPTFQLSPGFSIDVVRRAGPEEDSWISIAIDPDGQIVIAKEQQGLLRMTLSSDGGQVERVETIDDELKECRGLLFSGGHLFVNANNSKRLYRIEQRPDGSLGEPHILYESEGGVGHGRNDLALGSDGSIYAIQGDSVRLPTDAVDYTSPLREARRGETTSEGHLLRINPTSGKVELFAAGLRNPFGIALNRRGDAFTYDADAEYDMGAPWYRPTRVNHVVLGGDYGWRGVTRSWPAYYPDHPDNALPNVDIGKGSPTAVKFAQHNQHWPAKYHDALFVLDWAYGRILAVHPIERGASYLMTAETFLKGKPLNVTDLEFAANGDMYFVTGGRKTQSALYRVRFTGAREVEGGKLTAQQKSRQEFANSARATRQSLEHMIKRKSPVNQQEMEVVWRQLDNPDPWLRHAARCVLERQPIESWRAGVFGSSKPHVPLEAYLALARDGDSTICAEVLSQLNEIQWSDLPLIKTRTLAYVYWLALRRLPTDSKVRGPVFARLGGEYPHGDYDVDRLLSEILTSSPHSYVDETMGRMRRSENQNQRMHFLYVLRNVKNGWTRENRDLFFGELREMQNYVGGQGMPDFITRVREDVEATLNDDERTRLGKLLDSSKDNHVVSVARPHVKQWQLSELAASTEVLRGKGNVEHGAKLFAAASCVQCHRFRNVGHSTGPDLTFVSHRFGRQDLLRSILQPSDVIAEKYQSLQIVTVDGKTIIGQPALGGDYRSEALRIAVDPLDRSKTITVPKESVESQQPSKVSWMPTGLLDSLSQSDIIDLLTFLESLDDR